MTAVPAIRPARCRYPFVLLHGLFGFVEKKIGPMRLVYYHDVIPYLESVGNRAYAIKVDPRGTIRRRVEQIEEQISNHPDLVGSPIHLIGHSMGGLDARDLVSTPELRNQVKSVTTLSTPHRGSFLADLIAWIPGMKSLIPALQDLTEKSAEEFNRSTPDQQGTVYFSVPAETSFVTCCPLLWPTYLLLRVLRGPNDGQVSVESAKWGEVLEIARADHFEIVGMRYGLNRFSKRSHLDIFGKISHALAERGL